jgi:hypothetical protein
MTLQMMDSTAASGNADANSVMYPNSMIWQLSAAQGHHAVALRTSARRARVHTTQYRE